MEERIKRVKTVEKLSQTQQMVSGKKREEVLFKSVHKQISQKLIPQNSHLQTNRKQLNRHVRSQTMTGNPRKISNPYDQFVKELDIVLPSPRQKFYEFIEISPFDRNTHHLQLIQHFLRQYKFFQIHPIQLMPEFAKKVKLQTKANISPKQILIIESGEANYLRETFRKGDPIGRFELNTQNLICSTLTKFLTINRHEYQYFLNSYLEKEKDKFKNFLANVQILKIFPSKVFNLFVETLTLKFLTAGQYLYRFGDSVSKLYIVFQGKASRKVIVEIDKVNKIPMLKYSKIVKILSKSYQHKIQFQTQDLIGIAQVIDNIETRKENIKIQQNSIILCLDKNVFQEHLDQYIIDRFRKQNMKKYPITYDKLCEKFDRDKTILRQQQMRKIQALRSTINNTLSQKKSQKINLIIKKYQENIKKSERNNLLDCKVQQRKMQRQ